MVGGFGDNTTKSLTYANLFKKRTEAYCKDVPSSSKQLNNGRSCKNNWQCLSQNCGSDGVCHGMNAGEFCNNHADCDA